MIQANELRIGNFVSSDNYDISRIVSISAMGSIEYVHYGITDGEIGLWQNADIYPIVITEKWILKFVFYSTDNGMFVFDDNNYFSIDAKGGLYHDDIYTATDIKYVHQLQNLYFALTGEELKLKNQTI